MNAPFPTAGRLAGVDYGAVRIGLALSDPERKLASPLETYVRRDEAADAHRFRRLALEEQLAGFVVGLPTYACGAEGGSAAAARRFGAWLTEATGLPVQFVDERYTTALAEELLRSAGLKASQRKKLRDRVAAQAILAAFLESGGRCAESEPLDDRRPRKA